MQHFYQFDWATYNLIRAEFLLFYYVLHFFSQCKYLGVLIVCSDKDCFWSQSKYYIFLNHNFISSAIHHLKYKTLKNIKGMLLKNTPWNMRYSLKFYPNQMKLLKYTGGIILSSFHTMKRRIENSIAVLYDFEAATNNFH